MLNKNLDHSILPLYCASWGVNPMFNEISLLLPFLGGGVVACCCLRITQVVYLSPRPWDNIAILSFRLVDLHLL